jgi:hypothetical protein
MSTITTTMFSATHASRWDQLHQLQMELQRLDQVVSRPEQAGLRDAIFYDIGISDPHRKLNKPFWMA